MATGSKLRVVIVGAGFGGIAAARSLTNARVEITLIDRTNHHLFQPLLYQVATAALSPGDIAQPIRAILRGRDNVRVVMDNVVRIDTHQRIVIGTESEYHYDYLILSPGARHSYFGHDDWERHAPGLKTLEDALHLRTLLLGTFEAADRAQQSTQVTELLTFVVVGGGPTGVEMAGAIAEISMRTMLPDFPRIQRSQVRVLLVEAGNRLLPAFDQRLSDHAVKSLTELGVDVRLHTQVVDVTKHGVLLQRTQPESSSNNTAIEITTNNVIWAAGNVASPLLQDLQVTLDRQGRVVVHPTCSVPGHEEIFVLGDAAHLDDGTGKPLPGVAQTAVQMGTYVAKELSKQANGRTAFSKPFMYKDLGSMATIGRARAVADVFGLKISGFAAWLAWAGLHILKLISFRNRLKVLIEWLWYYVSFQPGARLLYDVRQKPQEEPIKEKLHEHC